MSEIIGNDLEFELNGSTIIVTPEDQVAQFAWEKIQDRIRQDGVSTIPLETSANCRILDDNTSPATWAYSIYRPQAIYSWARKEINISASLVMTTAVNAATDDYVTLLTGLPSITKAANNSGNGDDNAASFGLYNAIEVHPANGDTSFTLDGLYTTKGMANVLNEADLANVNTGVYSTAFVRKTAEHWTYDSSASKWVRRYTPSGVLQINFVDNKTRNAMFSIASGDIITISTQPYSLATKAGAFIFPRIYPIDITRVSAWVKAHRGMYDYTNNGRWRRALCGETIYNSSPYTGLGATDCSGMIYQAFRYGAGKSVPDGTKVMIGYGRVVTFARAGEELNVSALREGDIVGWITATASTRLGACHHVGIVVKGMPDDPDDDKLRIWHQTTTFNCYTQEADDGDTKADHVIPSYASYAMDSVVSDVAGDNPVKKTVYGPQPVASQPYGDPVKMSVSRNNGNVYTDANYGIGDARIVVRWLDDSDNLRMPDANYDPDDVPSDEEAN